MPYVLCLLCSNDSLKGCHCSSSTMIPSATHAKNIQKNVNDNLFPCHVNFFHSEFHSLNMGKCVFQPCVLLNSLSCKRDLFQSRGHRTSTYPQSGEDGQNHGQSEQNQVLPPSVRCGLRPPLEDPMSPITVYLKGLLALLSKGPRLACLTVSQAWGGSSSSQALPQQKAKTEDGQEPTGLAAHMASAHHPDMTLTPK